MAGVQKEDCMVAGGDVASIKAQYVASLTQVGKPDANAGLCNRTSAKRVCAAAVTNTVDKLTAEVTEEAKVQEILDKARPLFDEVGRFCYRDVNKVVKYKTGQCVADVLGNPANQKAGTSSTFKYQREFRELFKDTPKSPAKVKDTFLETNIVIGTTSVEDLLVKARESVIKPPAPPLPAPSQTAGAGEIAYDSDGSMQREPVTSETKEPGALPVSGSVAGSLSPSVSPTGEMGYRAVADLKGGIYKGPRLEVNWHGIVDLRRDLGIPSDPHFATGSTSEGKPKDKSHLHFAIESRYALNGTTVSLPGGNLIATNDQARKLEKLMTARWGEKAARIYLDSVVYPLMAGANSEESRAERWDASVVQGSKEYEKAIKGEDFDKDKVSDLFQYDLPGAIKVFSLITGKTDKEIGDSWTQRDKDGFKAFAQANIQGSKYELPGNYQEQTDPATFKPDPGWITLGDYKDKLVGMKEAFIKASGESEEALKAIATEKNIPYPFDTANIPDNPWAAQKIYNDFAAAVAEKQEKATVFLTNNLGIQDVNPMYDHPALGDQIGVEYAPSDLLTTSVKVYGGAGESHLIAEEPTLLQGKAYALTVGAEWHIAKSKRQWYRDIMVAGELIYSDGNKLPEYFTPHFMLAPTVAFGSDSPVTFTPSLDYYRGFDREGGADVDFAVAGAKLAYALSAGASIYAAYQLKWLRVKDNVCTADCETPGRSLNRPVEGPAEADNALGASVGIRSPQHRGALGVTIGALGVEAGIVRRSQDNIYNSADEGTGAKTWADFVLKWTF